MTDDEKIDTLMNMCASEPLHPDLLPYVQVHARMGKMIHHKWIVEIMYVEVFNKRINTMYKHKEQATEIALAAQDWKQYIFLHERPYRLDALLEIMDSAGFWDDPTPVFWDLLVTVWMDSENIHQNLDAWRDLWSVASKSQENGYGAIHPHVMDDEELAAFQALPETVTVYRGTSHRKVISGMSWTTDKTKAEWFATRFTTPHQSKNIAKGIIAKKDILAYLIGRGESEVVAFPEDIEHIRVSRLFERKKESTTAR
jgi:hypothetical protein